MKRTPLFITILLAIISIALIVPAQTAVTKTAQTDALLISQNTTAIDSESVNVYSQWFTIQGFNGVDLSSTPIYFTKLLSSAYGKPRVTSILEGSNDQTNIFAVDSLGGASDSVETIQKGTLTLNANKFYYYRFHDKGETGNLSDAYVKKEILLVNPNK